MEPVLFNTESPPVELEPSRANGGALTHLLVSVGRSDCDS